MNARTKKVLLLLLAAALLFGSSRMQQSLNRDRDQLGLVRASTLQNAPPMLAFTTVALGGFRGLISNLLWMRANDLIEEVKEMAAKEITKRYPAKSHPELKEKQRNERARAIALAAIKFYLLKNDAKREMLFDPEKSLAELHGLAVFRANLGDCAADFRLEGHDARDDVCARRIVVGVLHDERRDRLAIVLRAACVSQDDDERGQTQAEIAARLDVPLGTVKARAARGLRRLAALLNDGESR